MKKERFRYALAGALAGFTNGFFGGGGGSIFVPALMHGCKVEQKKAFATSIAVILPLSILSAVIYSFRCGLNVQAALPYIIGGGLGGLLGGRLFRNVKAHWIKRIFGIVLLFGGVRSLFDSGDVSHHIFSSYAASLPSILQNWVLPVVIGGLAGIMSGFGVGGGTILLVYLTLVLNMDQHLAQGINLLYFLPAALLALPTHVKNGYIEKSVLLPAISTGLVMAAFAAWISTGLDVHLLRKIFGGFLSCMGLWELFSKKPADE